MNVSTLDCRFHHPFTCLVSGPTRSGKSTFVSNLLLNAKALIDTQFDFIYVFLGTDLEHNAPFLEMKKKVPKIKFFELHKLYTPETMKSDFPSDFAKKVYRRKNQKENGCVIFDDLMRELSECDMLVDMFTKYSSHGNMSTIHVTQNLFFKGGGKHTSDNATLYRNTHIVVLFKNPMDKNSLRIVGSRLASPSEYKCLINMLEYILNTYRYVVIRGDFRTDPRLMYTTNIFATEPFQHMLSFELKAENCR